jgi:polyhydroxybutyrate depolymerase
MLACTLLLCGISFTVSNPSLAPIVSADTEDALTTLPITSSGCGKPSPIVPGTSVQETIFSGDIERTYLLYIPRGYRDTVGQPLVLDFHGHGSNAELQQYRTGFSAFADTYGVIVAYPQGVVGPDHRTGWATGPRWDPRTNDVLFASDLLNHLQSTLCINPHKIFATGFSNGGGMTNMLACKLAGRFAAFASVSGAYPAMPGGCDPTRAVPFFEMHGTADRIVPYNGSFFKGYPPVALWLQQWARRDGCTVGPIVFFNQDNIIGEKWTGCRNHVTIVHYQIGGMGHLWPRHLVFRYQDHAVNLNANTLIWSFFQRYPLPANTLITHGSTPYKATSSMDSTPIGPE